MGAMGATREGECVRWEDCQILGTPPLIYTFTGNRITEACEGTITKVGRKPIGTVIISKAKLGKLFLEGPYRKCYI